MNHRHRLVAVAVSFGVLGLGALPGAPLPASRPNVLIVLCDDLRWDHLSCAGHPHLQTPNIDRIAREGVRFANAFCTTSLCSPSRASILSGLYAHSHGVLDNFTEFPVSLPALHTRLHECGYDTGYVGKWHMGENRDEQRPGFDYWASHKGQGKYFDTEFNVAGVRQVLPGYYTQAVTELARGFIGRDHGGKPWFLILGHKAPHSFYTPEEKYAHRFDSVPVPYPDSAFDLGDKPTWYRDRLTTWHGIYGPLFEWRKRFPDPRPEAVKDFENMVHGYWAVIQSVDDSMGVLWKSLEERRELDRTIVVFMGDNGLLAGENGMVDKRAMHDASIRIPLLVRFPGLISQPKEEQAQVLTLDLAPSLLELCGCPPLERPHGRSWVKLVREGDPGWRSAWFYEYNYEKQFPYTPNIRGVRTDSWKYIRYPHGDGSPDRHLAELYDLVNDPGERRNRIADPSLAAKRQELANLLEKLEVESGVIHDRMPLDEGVKSALPDQKIR